MGDVPAAVRQYDRWIGAMAACEDDLERARRVRPGFRPLLSGFHWPSLPFGDEELGGGRGVVVRARRAPPGRAARHAGARRRLRRSHRRHAGGTRGARRRSSPRPPTTRAPRELPPEVVDAYRVLDRESGLGAGGPAEAPGDDREPFDPEAAYDERARRGRGEVSFGVGGFAARTGGRHPAEPVVLEDEGPGADARRDRLPHAAGRPPASGERTGRDVRFHLMGHSFGCIVMSATLAGPPERATAEPVHSAILAQGAVSFWSYCSDIPHAKGSRAISAA